MEIADARFDPPSSDEYRPASGCITADPMPPSTTHATSAGSDVAAGVAEIATAVSATDDGKNHQRPRRSLYAPTIGCAIELVRYHANASAPWHQAGKPARVTSKKITNGRMPEYRSLAPCANAISETPRRSHGRESEEEAVVTRAGSPRGFARLAREGASVASLRIAAIAEANERMGLWPIQHKRPAVARREQGIEPPVGENRTEIAFASRSACWKGCSCTAGSGSCCWRSSPRSSGFSRRTTPGC